MKGLTEFPCPSGSSCPAYGWVNTFLRFKQFFDTQNRHPFLDTLPPTASILPSARNSELQVHQRGKAALPFTQTQEPAPYSGLWQNITGRNGQNKCKEETMPLEVSPPLAFLKRKFHPAKRQLSPERIKRLQGWLPVFSGNTSWSVLHRKYPTGPVESPGFPVLPTFSSRRFGSSAFPLYLAFGQKSHLHRQEGFLLLPSKLC